MHVSSLMQWHGLIEERAKCCLGLTSEAYDTGAFVDGAKFSSAKKLLATSHLPSFL